MVNIMCSSDRFQLIIKNALLLINSTMLSIGGCGGPLVSRLYFIHGGKRIWLSSWLETGGWPIMIFVLIASYFYRRAAEGSAAKPIRMKLRVFIASAVMGVLTGFDDYMYAFGLARLPVSTSALVIATQLAFTAGFAFLLVKQKFTFHSLNAIVLLTVGAGVLALHTSGDRPDGVSEKEYIMGFLLTLAAAALYGLVLPLVELMYKKANQTVDYVLVMEIQTIICFFATLVCTVGMLVNNDFKAIPLEAKNYELGEAMYYLILVCSAITWQLFFLGAIGVIFCSSSLLSGIIIAVLLPTTEVLAVLFYREKFQAEKGVSLFLSLLGFANYLYGEKQRMKEKSRAAGQMLGP